MNKFNIFSILEKGDKELVHSAFIKFLFEYDEEFRKQFFNIENKNFEELKLEASYRKGNKKGNIRIDFQINIDNHKYISIENKFKSFPYKNQLEEYSRILNRHLKGKEINKYLFCFDGKLINFQIDWKVYDYRELYEYIEKIYKADSEKDENIFIKHYKDFLGDYINKYDEYKGERSSLLKKVNTNAEKFYRSLLNAYLGVRFSKEFSKFDIASNSGNTTSPLLNIIPKHWRTKTNKELLVQFQDDNVKFYYHSENKEELKEIIEFCKDKLWSNKIELKKITKKKEKSSFIFRIKIEKGEYSFDDIYNLILDFYKNIDNRIMKYYLK